jgi:hypothetical protein
MFAGAAQMMDMELQLNRYARAQCKGHCADFIGELNSS